MPLTPLASAASMSAVCLGEASWPSDSIVLRPCLAASASNPSFIIWTKKGKFMPGTESRMSGLSSAKAGVESAIASRLAVTTRRVIRMDGILPGPAWHVGWRLGQPMSEIGRGDKGEWSEGASWSQGSFGKASDRDRLRDGVHLVQGPRNAGRNNGGSDGAISEHSGNRWTYAGCPHQPPGP